MTATQTLDISQYTHGQPLKITTTDGKEHLGQYLEKDKSGELYGVMAFGVLYTQARTNPEFKPDTEQGAVMLMLGDNFQYLLGNTIQHIENTTEQELLDVMQQKSNEKEQERLTYIKNIREALTNEDIQNLKADLLIPINEILGEVKKSLQTKYKKDPQKLEEIEAMIADKMEWLKANIGQDFKRALNPEERTEDKNTGRGIVVKLHNYPNSLPIGDIYNLIPTKRLQKKFIHAFNDTPEKVHIMSEDDIVYISICPSEKLTNPDDYRYFYAPLQQYRDIKAGKIAYIREQDEPLEMTVTSFQVDLKKLP